MIRYNKFFTSTSLLLWLIWTACPCVACPDIDGLVDINCDGKVQILCFGDSITYGRADPSYIGYPGRLAILFPHVVVLNLGKPGEQTYNGRARAAQVMPLYADSDYAIVLEGVNDYWLQSRSSSHTKSNVLAILNTAKGLGAISLLGNLTAIKRSEQKWWVSAVNGQINPYRQIDFFSLGEGIISSDLIHPHGHGYWDMANLASGILKSYSEANRPVDTDADGIYDFAEPRFGTNPNVADTEGDGLLDGDEVFKYKSSPLMDDTDSDGFSDYQEVIQMGSDPADPRPTAPTLESIDIILPEDN